MTLRHELDVAGALAREAGAVLLRHRDSGFTVGRKAGGEVVTPADLESDRLIREGLTAAFPGDAIFSEETPDTPARLRCERVWIVDPLDATSDYAAAGSDYVVSIGLAVGGRAALGVIHCPSRDELTAGALGAGVTLNGESVGVSGARALRGARIAISRKELAAGLPPAAAALAPIASASMAHKLARVAGGRDDAAISLKPRKEWGTCAGVALVHAAGGIATLLDGGEIGFNRSEARQRLGMVAATPTLHALLLSVLAPHTASQA